MKASFFKNNRQRLMRTVKSNIVILAGHGLMQRTNDTSYGFVQEANFWYLTGIEAPNWQLVIEKTKSWLIAPDVDDIHHTFDGSLSAASARAISGVDEVVNHDEAKKRISRLAKKYSSVATLGKDPHSARYDFTLNPRIDAPRRGLKKQFKTIEDCRTILSALRAIKQPVEVAAIRKAINLTAEVFESFSKQRSGFTYEYEIEAYFTHYFRHHGATGHAYDPIVASGNNACTLHYIHNADKLDQKNLVLLDIGARVDGYSADITRTYAMGKPSTRQTAVHEAVETAHNEILKLLKPGLKIDDYLEGVDTIMKNALRGLDLLKSADDYRRYFPHAVSHGLGIDVHDPLGRPTEFQTGMIITVEPGIYIPEEGIGVRIEDDILITKTGHENLSAALPTSL